MLGLQVRPPAHLVFKLVVVLLQNLHRIGVAHPHKIRRDYVLQALQEALVHKLVAEGQILGAGLQHVADHGFHRRLDDVHVVVEVREGDLRLDHPEFRRVALGIGPLRPEGGPEGVHPAKGQGHTLRLQLAGHGEGGGLLEEVLLIVNGALFRSGQAVQIEGGHLEHLPRALAVAAGDNGRVGIDEAVLLEEFVHPESRRRTHPEGRAEQVGPGAQVGDGAQVLHGVALFLQGVLRG